MKKLLLFSLFSLLFFLGCRQSIQVEQKTRTPKPAFSTRQKIRVPEGPKEAEVHYQTATANPFMGGPPAAVSSGSSVAATQAPGGELTGEGRPSNLPRVIESPTSQPFQLPPLPQQETLAVPSVEVPEWKAQSPILTMGPPARWKNIVNLVLTGVVMSKNKGMKRAIIEERICERSTQLNTSAQGSPSSTGGSTTSTSSTSASTCVSKTRSYVVQVGETFSEWHFHVVQIEPRYIVVKKNAERIVLPLATAKRQETFVSPAGKGNILVPGTQPSSSVRTMGAGGLQSQTTSGTTSGSQ